MQCDDAGDQGAVVLSLGQFPQHVLLGLHGGHPGRQPLLQEIVVADVPLLDGDVPAFEIVKGIRGIDFPATHHDNVIVHRVRLGEVEFSIPLR